LRFIETIEVSFSLPERENKKSYIFAGLLVVAFLCPTYFNAHFLNLM